jgi:hypothetical protein
MANGAGEASGEDEMSNETTIGSIRTTLSGGIGSETSNPAPPAPEIVQQARQTVAERFPGCAAAICSNDPLSNWDRGQLVQDELAKLRKLAGNTSN